MGLLLAEITVAVKVRTGHCLLSSFASVGIANTLAASAFSRSLFFFA